MVVATLTLLAILFGGGALETFFIGDLNKGVKEYVLEEERKKEILADLKGSEELIKEFNKQRKSQFKEFKTLNISRETSSDDLVAYFDQMLTERGTYQSRFIDDRLAVTGKIKPGEWDAIISDSGQAEDKRKEKVQKKIDKAEAKGKEPFGKTRKAITLTVADAGKQQLLLGRLDAMIASFDKLAGDLAAININENDLLVRKDASRDEMMQFAEKMNGLRRAIFIHLVDFHMAVKENTDAIEWEKIMKKFNKDISLTAH